MLSKHQITRIVVSLIYPIAQILFRPVTKKHLTAFLFHEVTNSPSGFQLANSNYTTVENFEKNISWIAENYEVIEISQLANLSKSINKPLAIITFDDAWKGQLDASKHISSKYNLPITLFLNLGTIKSRIDIAALRNFNQIEIPRFNEFIVISDDEKSLVLDFLNWQGEIITMSEINEIDELEKSTLANHSLHHYPAIDLTDKEFMENVQLNEKELLKLSSFRKYFAFPFGRQNIDFNDHQLELLKSQNYQYIFSADGRLNHLPLKPHAILSRINFSPSDCKKSDFWWATNKSKLLRRG